MAPVLLRSKAAGTAPPAPGTYVPAITPTYTASRTIQGQSPGNKRWPATGFTHGWTFTTTRQPGWAKKTGSGSPGVYPKVRAYIKSHNQWSVVGWGPATRQGQGPNSVFAYPRMNYKTPTRTTGTTGRPLFGFSELSLTWTFTMNQALTYRAEMLLTGTLHVATTPKQHGWTIWLGMRNVTPFSASSHGWTWLFTGEAHTLGGYGLFLVVYGNQRVVFMPCAPTAHKGNIVPRQWESGSITIMEFLDPLRGLPVVNPVSTKPTFAVPEEAHFGAVRCGPELRDLNTIGGADGTVENAGVCFRFTALTLNRVI